jgi:hypothetical protein
MPPDHDADPSIGTSRLQVALAVDADADRAAAVLGEGRLAWLGEPLPAADDRDMDRFLIDLELRVSDRAPRVAFRKAAYVEVGPLASDPDGEAISLPISWRAAGMTPLFPVFAGRLSWGPGELRLDGYYAPPGGSVGLMADRLVMNAAARATGRRLLERIAESMRASAAGSAGGARAAS